MTLKVKFYFAGGNNWGVSRVIQSGTGTMGDLAFINIDPRSYEFFDDGYLVFTVKAGETRSFGNTSLTVSPTQTTGFVQRDDLRIRYNIINPVFFNDGGNIHFYCLVQSSDLIAE